LQGLKPVLAQWHFDPTETSRLHLPGEGVAPDAIHVTGNTVIDALLQVRGKIVNSPALRQQLDQAFRFLDPAKRLVLVTGVPYPNYFAGAQFIHFLPRPAVVALGLQGCWRHG
jgi:UDP-N-acetylglucosamine 2-epimerase (non-hydrolysing)